MEPKKKITNIALVELELCGKKETVESNETETNIVKLIVTKEAGCKFVLAGGDIAYTVKIKNDSDIALCDLEFKDTLDNNTQFVAGSFKVNGVTKTPHVTGHTISYLIDEIEAGETITITFEVKVKCEDEEDEEC